MSQTGDMVSIMKQSPPSDKSVQAQDILPLVVYDMAKRSRFGAEKYNTPLRTHNGRSAIIDSYQEQLDNLQYTRQHIQELRDIAKELFKHGADVHAAVERSSMDEKEKNAAWAAICRINIICRRIAMMGGISLEESLSQEE